MKNKIGFFIILMGLLCSSIGSTQVLENVIRDIEEQPVEIVDTLDRKYDTRPLKVRELKTDLEEEYSSGEFNYERIIASNQNIFSKFISWLISGIQELFGFTLSPLTIKILTYLFYFIIGMAVLYMIIKLVGNESMSNLFGKTKKKSSSVTIEDTHIEEIDFTNLITDNEREGNYRNAIRYQYLSLLKDLSAKRLIDWDFQKTNTDYYRELGNPQLKEFFKNVSYWYDHVWYGEFPIDEHSYKQAVTEFQSLKNKTA